MSARPPDPRCGVCVETEKNCGGHWRGGRALSTHGTRGKPTLDIYDGDMNPDANAYQADDQDD